MASKACDDITYSFPNVNGLGMDKYFHPTWYDGGGYLFMSGLKLNHVSKRGPWASATLKKDRVAVFLWAIGMG